MIKRMIPILLIFLLIIPNHRIGHAITNKGNPVIKDSFSADPAALVHNGKVYLYVGHDEAATNDNFFVLKEWSIYSSTDMNNWTREGTVPRTIFEWADRDSAWAGQVIERDGKFYWYTTVYNPDPNEKGYSIGVAVSDDPVKGWKDAIGGPLVSNSMTPNPESMGEEPWDNIDPTVFIDDDGQAYLYWGNTHLYYAKLKDNMVELDGEIHQVSIDGMQGSYTEAPWLHKYNGKYYLSFAMNWPEEIGYAISDSPAGPWTFAGKLMDSTGGSGTNHQSIIEYAGQWYFIYHNAALPTGGDYRRSVSIEELNYYPDGKIKKMRPTASGINDEPRLLQVKNENGYVFHSNDEIRISSLSGNRYNYQWYPVPGLADSGEAYISFQAENKPGYYLKRDGSTIILAKNNGTQKFKEQATFKVVSGLADDAFSSFQAYNAENLYLFQKEDHTLGLSATNLIGDKNSATFQLKEANVNGIELNIHSEVLKEGTETVLTAKTLPDDALIKDVKFFSSNPDVLSVSGSPYITPEGEVNVMLSAHSKGQATLTAITEDGHFSSSVNLEVIENKKKPQKMKDVNVTFNPSTKEILIEGQLKNKEGRLVAARIVDPSGNSDYIKQTLTGEKGQFTFNYKSTNVHSGEYHVEIYSADPLAAFQTSFTMSPQVTAHYEFDNNLHNRTGTFGSGTVTGNRINNEGGNITHSDGILGEAALFNGESGIKLPNGLIKSHTYSVSLWLNPEELTQFTTTFFGARDMNNWVSLVPKGPGAGNTMVWSGTKWYDADTGVAIQPNQWTHLAFVVDNGNINVYMNGEETFSGTGFPDVFTSASSVFGLGVNYWDTPYKGLMDDLKIYDNTVLSEEEIKNEYNNGIHSLIGDPS
ncbi:family 43 glycosylhydrolase [uncultured Metabacillus sp.]|uniref:family 43 glycosylhydrolase n=1 Tax=uncultured Metabacillus sp. TaxID=2860135 RepID=UPI00262A0274|nr:family 43 glycosylhydrolase [uncultured Metabacillus sp.]